MANLMQKFEQQKKKDTTCNISVNVYSTAVAKNTSSSWP